jgi:hypothetical protein
MKTHHAAALWLAVWYLILPPSASSGKRLTDAPLSDWKSIDEFDSQSTCIQMRAKLIKSMPSTEIDTALFPAVCKIWRPDRNRQSLTIWTIKAASWLKSGSFSHYLL